MACYRVQGDISMSLLWEGKDGGDGTSMRPADVLLSEPRPLLVRKQLALAVGLQEAIQLQQLHWLLDHFDSRSVELDGRRWLRGEIKFWCTQFPWSSESTIKRSFDNLKARGLIERNRGREASVYTVNYEAVDDLARKAQSDPGQWLLSADDTTQAEPSPSIGEENSRETGENSPGADPPALFDTPASEPSPSPASTAPDDGAVTVWAHYVNVFGDAHLRIKGLTPARSRMIEKAIKASTVEVCCAAIDGLKSYRAANPHGSKDISLDAIFATRPGGRNITDQIEFWASQADEQRGFDLSRVPSVLRPTVQSNRQLVRKGLESDDEHTRRMGREAAERLREKFNIVPIINDGKLDGWRYDD